MIRPQSEFPLLERYKEHFPINDSVIFAYDNVIYSNYELPHDLIIHERTHFKQQAEVGLDKWVDLYLSDVGFRAKQEEQAYRNQLNSIKDRNQRHRIRQAILSDIKETKLYGDVTLKI